MRGFRYQHLVGLREIWDLVVLQLSARLSQRSVRAAAHAAWEVPAQSTLGRCEIGIVTMLEGQRFGISPIAIALDGFESDDRECDSILGLVVSGKKRRKWKHKKLGSRHSGRVV